MASKYAVTETVERVVTGKGKESWVFRSMKPKDGEIRGQAEKQRQQQPVGKVDWILSADELTITAVQDASRTVLSAKNRASRAGGWVVSVETDTESLNFDVDSNGLPDSKTLSRFIKKTGAIAFDQQKPTPSMQLMADLDGELLAAGLGHAGPVVVYQKAGAKTKDECKEEYDSDMASIGQNIVETGLLTGIGLGLGWSGVGLVLAGISVWKLKRDTEKAQEDAEEEYKECVKNAPA